MELVIRAATAERRVRVERDGDRYVVEISEIGEAAESAGSGGSRRYEVDIVELGAQLRSLLIGGQQFDVGLVPLPGDRYRVSWDGQSEIVEVADPLTHLARASRQGEGAQGHREVRAYMPGRVVSLAVSEGDAVVAGQALLVLEAMKMQNEIQAETDGTVVKIHVAPGEAVEGGDPLVEIG